uniref:LITAF domain-containing protein n=1 Tax=Denticeps clupeoides TaxID=299321 RepID=A0AAY4CPV4_9TELE
MSRCYLRQQLHNEAVIVSSLVIAPILWICPCWPVIQWAEVGQWARTLVFAERFFLTYANAFRSLGNSAFLLPSASTMSASPEETEWQLQRVKEEMNSLSLQSQQLTDRQVMLVMLKDFRMQSGQMITEEDIQEETEMRNIKQDLNSIQEKKKDLMKKQEIIENQMRRGGQQDGDFDLSCVCAPPKFPAPKVMDVTDLTFLPGPTQCPHCHELILTETAHTIGSATWLVCIISMMFGCVAGCCLIPFCTNTFKNVEHKCPKCRSALHTWKKL